MRFISSLCWVRRGCSKTPTKIKLDKNEMKDIFGPIPSNNKNDEEIEDEEAEEDGENDELNSDSETRKISKKYKLDDYDEEGLLTNRSYDYNYYQS